MSKEYGLSKTDPWNHQSIGYQYLCLHSSALVWYGMGTGKTKILIDKHRNSGVKWTIIVCPHNVMEDGVWEKEFDLHCADPLPEIVVLDKGTAKQKSEIVRKYRERGSDHQVVFIINYEAIWREHLGPIYEKNEKGKKVQVGKGVLLSYDWDMIIADEVHRIKGHNSSVSKFFHKLAKVTRSRIGLTGTPLPNSPLDAFGIYRFLEEAIFGWSWMKFRSRYAVMGGPDMNWVKSFQNIDELTALMGSIAICCTADDVLDLPDKVDRWIYCKLSAKARRIYNEIERDLISFMVDPVAYRIAKMLQPPLFQRATRW